MLTHTHTHTQPNEPMVPVNLTDIELDGVVILQVQGPGLNQLQQLMTIINDTYMHKVVVWFSSTTLNICCCGAGAHLSILLREKENNDKYNITLPNILFYVYRRPALLILLAL